MKISREQIEFMKNASDHVDRLCGGRGYGKTHQLIKEMEDKINKLQSNWNSLREWLEKQISNDLDGIFSYSGRQCKETLDKMNELEGKNK